MTGRALLRKNAPLTPEAKGEVAYELLKYLLPTLVKHHKNDVLSALQKLQDDYPAATRPHDNPPQRRSVASGAAIAMLNRALNDV